MIWLRAGQRMARATREIVVFRSGFRATFACAPWATFLVRPSGTSRVCRLALIFRGRSSPRWIALMILFRCITVVSSIIFARSFARSDYALRISWFIVVPAKINWHKKFPQHDALFAQNFCPVILFYNVLAYTRKFARNVPAAFWQVFTNILMLGIAYCLNIGVLLFTRIWRTRSINLKSALIFFYLTNWIFLDFPRWLILVVYFFFVSIWLNGLKS